MFTCILVTVAISLSVLRVESMASDSGIWISATVNETAMDANVTQKEVFPAWSWISCASLAMHLDWSWMACYSATQVSEECHVWSAKDVYNGGGRKLSVTVGDAPCKVRKGYTGCFKASGAMAAFGEIIPDSMCPDDLQRICTADLVLPLSVPQKRTTCPDYFENTDVGCLLFDENLKSWCEARKFCLDEGGDLYSTDTARQFADFRNYMQAHRPNDDTEVYWVGATNVNGEWEWMGSGRDPGPTGQGDWYSATSEPNGSGLQCARIEYEFSFKLADSNCPRALKVVCQIRV